VAAVDIKRLREIDVVIRVISSQNGVPQRLGGAELMFPFDPAISNINQYTSFYLIKRVEWIFVSRVCVI
jgi:hypothetical protein